jgi:hypothetical protein
METLLAIGIILVGLLVLAIIRIKAREFSKRYVWVYGPIIFLYVGLLAMLLLSGYISLDEPEGLQKVGLFVGVVTAMIVCGFGSGKWKIREMNITEPKE